MYSRQDAKAPRFLRKTEISSSSVFLCVSASLRDYIPAVLPLLVFFVSLVSSCDLPACRFGNLTRSLEDTKVLKERRRCLFQVFALLVPLLFKILAVSFGKEFSQQRSKENTWSTEANLCGHGDYADMIRGKVILLGFSLAHVRIISRVVRVLPGRPGDCQWA
mgnify:CR=1 FL=1